MTSSEKLVAARRLEGNYDSVWLDISRLAAENNALNLSLGNADFLPPEHVTTALKEAAASPNPSIHQYTRSYGHPRFVKAIAKTFSPLFGREISEFDEILVTIGADGSLFCAVHGFVNPGDEVILIEPFYDPYEVMVRLAGGVPIFIALKPDLAKKSSVMSSADWKLDPVELASKFSSKTKAIIFNNPNNPLGKVYEQNELEMIAGLCKKHDVLVIADEVYERLVYKPNKHLRIANLPGMWDRTVTIGSAGKTFSVTGWKLGWSIGPKHLIHPLCTLHQNCNYTCPTPMQEAAAISFEHELARGVDSSDCYYNSLPVELQGKRDRMAALLSQVGLIPTIPEGGFLMLADFSKFDIPFDKSSNAQHESYQFATWLCKNKKLATIPNSAFYTVADKHLSGSFVRFCFIKKDSTLDKLADIIEEWKLTL